MKRSALALLCALTLVLASGPRARAQPTEYQLKAVFLLNFARYIEWPAEALPSEGRIEVCVLGRDPFGDALEVIDGKRAQERLVTVRLLALPEQAHGCHLLFVSGSEERKMRVALREVEGLPVLTVSDIEGFAEAGGGIGFATVDDRIRFDVNSNTLQRAKLRASAQLMKIARHVIGLEGGR